MKILLKENLNFFKNQKLNKKFNFVNIFNKIFLRYIYIKNLIFY